MIPKLPFGRTGHESTRLIFGAAALFKANDHHAGRALELLLENGINHIDVAASYGDAELWVGGWMDAHRGDFFLATKTGERDHAGARDSIRRSLERLRTDRLDLIQFHNLATPDELEQVFSEDGALRAALEARDEGLVRFIGVTGHGTMIAAMHLRSLARFDFDSVLLPYNFSMMSQPAYAEDFEDLLEACESQGVAVQTIKSLAQRRWQENEARHSRTWYAAFTEPEDVRRSVQWALARPGVFVNSASDLNLLPMVIEAAHAFPSSLPPADAEMEQLSKERSVEPLFLPGLDDVRA